MARKASASKSAIPKKLQLPLLLAGIPLLLFVGYRFATQMGWIGGPPEAVVRETPDEPSEQPEPVVEDPGTTPAVVRPVTDDDLPELASIVLGPRDPLADLVPEPKTPEPPAAGDAIVSGSTVTPGPPPPLPGPIPGPMVGDFPSPTGGPLGPPVLVNRPVQTGPTLPPALTTAYPQVHRGSRAAAKAAPIALLGTISGSNGAMAVLRQTDVAGGRGAYVRPGDEVGRTGHHVDEIEEGRVKVRSGGRSHELILPGDGGHTAVSGAAGQSGSVAPGGETYPLSTGTGSITVSPSVGADDESEPVTVE
ncbi:MAG TPA: hypothetical protein QGH10_22110 [Armatimonadota bacterium]|nr:hypothetical protein [Armatimonadota bacterium]